MAHLHWMFIPRASFPALVMLWFVFDFLCLRTFEDFLFKVRKPSKVNLGEKIYGKIFKKPLARAKIKYYIRLYEFKCCEDARISRIKFWHLKRESFYVSKKLIWAGAFNSKAWWILVVVWAVFLPESGVESTSESSESMIFINPSRHLAAGWFRSGEEHLRFSICRIGASVI